MIISVKALDTLFFKDGKPFSMGEESWADCIFPPYPSVFYGALRSVYFANKPEDLSFANTDEDPTKALRIKGIFLMNGDNVLFPVPLDFVKEKNQRERKGLKLSLTENKIISNLPKNIEKILMFSDENSKVENISGGYIDSITFEDYLNGEGSIFYLNIANFVKNEPKIGIGCSNITHTSEEGKLYRVDMKRLKNLEILVDFENLNIPDEGLMKLGGEGKAVSYKKIQNTQKINIKSPKMEDKIFKLYLSTPAIFKKGWLPDWIDEDTLEGSYNGLKLKLLTVALGKPIYIGGFDMKKRKPKPMYKAIPGGSVYYFDLKDGSMDDVINHFHNRPISDIYPEQGFGISYVGKI